MMIDASRAGISSVAIRLSLLWEDSEGLQVIATHFDFGYHVLLYSRDYGNLESLEWEST